MSAPSDDDEDLRRERILRAADELLLHHGTRKTTVADIARRAGVAVGSVYLEFDSKDALVGTLAELRFTRVLDAMLAAAANDAPDDPPRAICAAMRARTRTFLDLVDCGQHARDLVHGACSGVVFAHERFVARQHALLVDLLEQGRQRGVLRVDDPSTTAHAIILAHVAFAPPLLSNTLCTDPLAALDALHRVLLDGLR